MSEISIALGTITKSLVSFLFLFLKFHIQNMVIFKFFMIIFLFLSFLSLIVIVIENDIESHPLNLIVYS